MNPSASTEKISAQTFANEIGLVLRYGLFLSATVVALGYIFLIMEGSTELDYRRFRGHTVPGHRGVLDIVGHRNHTHLGADIIEIGILLLILTPIARVATSLFVFQHEKDRTYTILTAIVLAILVFTLLGG